MIVGLLLAILATSWLIYYLIRQPPPERAPSSQPYLEPLCKEEDSPGPVVEDYRGTEFRTFCVRTYGLRDTQIDGGRYKRLKAGVHGMACQKRFEKPNPEGTKATGEPATNHWWLWTQGDAYVNRGTAGWGWFPATYVTESNDEEPIPGVEECGDRVDSRP